MRARPESRFRDRKKPPVRSFSVRCARRFPPVPGQSGHFFARGSFFRSAPDREKRSQYAKIVQNICRIAGNLVKFFE